MKKNPIDDALAEIMDAWMDMMSMPRKMMPRYAGIEIPSMRRDDIGDWEDKNGASRTSYSVLPSTFSKVVKPSGMSSSKMQTSSSEEELTF